MDGLLGRGPGSELETFGVVGGGGAWPTWRSGQGRAKQLAGYLLMLKCVFSVFVVVAMLCTRLWLASCTTQPPPFTQPNHPILHTNYSKRETGGLGAVGL